ncbi:flagellar basal body rod protein FlgB [Buchnera aphidicola (Formosaphis micheliae)]|uniref:flagellar basal body rod protein FlgB n=1 Tax=Buchnera aphidicola TaxID=9 RepID=UPI0031B7F500
MFDKINNLFQFSKDALNLRDFKQTIISSNIANASTPNYHPIDINFAHEINKILNKKTKIKNYSLSLSTTSNKHFTSNQFNINKLKSSVVINNTRPYISNNVVNMDKERIKFIKNTLKYQAQITFLKNEIQNIINAIKG